jgi:transcriptional regulator with XRE-family HTH domain
MELLSIRVKAAVIRLYQERRFTQAALAEHLGVDPSAAHGYVNGDTVISLDVLQGICEVAGERPAELVAPPGSLVKQLNPDEARLIRALRMWDKSVTQALSTFVTFFAGEPLADQQSRNHHAIWRGLRRTERDYLHGVAQMLRSRKLSPDLQAAIVDHLLKEADRPSALPTVGLKKHDDA